MTGMEMADDVIDMEDTSNRNRHRFRARFDLAGEIFDGLTHDRIDDRLQVTATA